MISALRARTAPDSITPEDLGSILQHIANLIAALSNIDVSTETNLIARVEQLEGDMQTALGNSQSASSLAADMIIDDFSLGSDNVTITVQQSGYSALSITLQPATTTKAGVMSAEDKDHLDKAYQRTLYQLTTSSYSDKVTLNYKRHNDQVVSVNFVGATSSEAGLMTAADKVLLDSLSSSVSTISQVQQQVLALAGDYAPLNPAKHHVIPLYEGFLVLDSMGADLDTVDGATYDFTRAEDKCWYDPSLKMIVYWWNGTISASRYDPTMFRGIFFNRVTGRCYRWNATLEEMQEWMTNLM